MSLSSFLRYRSARYDLKPSWMRSPIESQAGQNFCSTASIRSVTLQILCRQDQLFDVLGRGIDFGFALRHGGHQPAPMAIGEQAVVAADGRLGRQMREQAIAEAVAGEVSHQRRIAAGELLAAAGDVVERPLQAEQVLIVVGQRRRGVAGEVHPPQQLDVNLADQRRHAVVEQLPLMLARGLRGASAGRA